MAKFEFKLPDIGEGVTEGEIVKWLIAEGDVVTEDQPMVEVMTDKATVTITAPKAGKVLERRAAEGKIIPVHSVLVVFDLDAGRGGGPAASPPAPAPTPAVAEGPAATAVGDIKESLPGTQLRSPPPGPAAKTNGGYFNDKPLATPATRKLARDLGVDLRTVAPTGKHGRVTKDDVADSAHPRDVSAPPAQPAPSVPVTRAPQAVSGQGDERVPLRGVRRRIFDAMARSKHTAAHFTFVEECDVTALKALRARLRPAAEKAGVKLTFLPFIVKACVAALKHNPLLGSAFDETTQEIVIRRRADIGIATAAEVGLMVPVLRDADRKSLLDIGREIARLSEGAREGKLRPDELSGSVFTITSLGAQGGLLATPILNFPEVAILGVHQIKQRPVVRDGQIVVGDVMLLSLSFDHRLIDGHVGAAFAYEIIEYLQDPERLFLEMGS